MVSYWRAINFQPETTEMNCVDLNEEEDESNKPETIDQVPRNPRKATLESEMANRYGGVVIKGFQKDSNPNDVIEILKEAGLPFDYQKEDLQIIEKFESTTIYIHDLKPETCVDIVNNLHGEEKLGKKISVYTLVKDTPTKQSGKELELLVLQENSEASNKSQENPAAVVTSEPNLDADPNLSNVSSSAGQSPCMLQTLVNGVASRFWANKDLDLSDDSSDDDSKDVDEELSQRFKRKATGSPDSENVFKEVLTKKEKKRLKNSLNKSS